MPARIPLLFCLLSVIPLDILLGISTCIFGTANKELLFLLTIFPCFVLFRFLLGVSYLSFFSICGGWRVGWAGMFPSARSFSSWHLLASELRFLISTSPSVCVFISLIMYTVFDCIRRFPCILRVLVLEDFTLLGLQSFFASFRVLYYTSFIIFFPFLLLFCPIPYVYDSWDDGSPFFPGFRYGGLSYQLMVSLFIGSGFGRMGRFRRWYWFGF